MSGRAMSADEIALEILMNSHRPKRDVELLTAVLELALQVALLKEAIQLQGSG